MQDSVKITGGGPLVKQSFAEKIGVNGCVPDAAVAADLAKKFVTAAQKGEF